MRIRPIFMLALAAMVAFGAFAQGSLTVTSQPPSCLSSLCGRSVINATVSGQSPAKSVRVYFRAGAEGPEYYIDMMAGADGSYSAVLPAPLRDTVSVTFRVVAVAEDGTTTSTEPTTMLVTSDCQLANLTDPEFEFATNTVIGLTEASQPAAPKGFSCAGIVKVVGVDQSMAPNNACDEVRLSDADPCFGAGGEPLIANAAKEESVKAAGIGLGSAAILGTAIVGAAVIVENNNDDPREPVSPARP